ncbi:MAG: hypothetical protein HKN94_04405 [Acidimicrobiales bacterium]|nr:hypothetical protein [Acidimicrobiales bacterium]RZV45201.1 MAG: hypothetical protein EX269_10505 [Acidimicrobiales bacterium]
MLAVNPAQRLASAVVAIALAATACSGGDEAITNASSSMGDTPAQSVSSSSVPPSTAPTTAAVSTTTAADDAPEALAFVASRDLGRRFVVTASLLVRTEPRAEAEEGPALAAGQTVRATRARLRTEGMWVEVSAVAPDAEALGWVLESAFAPASGTVQLANTSREGIDLVAADTPFEWLTIHDVPADETEVGRLRIGDQLIDTGGWALLENGDEWIEVADAATGQVKGWVRSIAVREVIVEETEVEVDETEGKVPEDGGEAESTETDSVDPDESATEPAAEDEAQPSP